MEENKKLTTPIGTKKPKKLEAVEVEIQGVKVEDVQNKTKDKKIGEKVVFLCKHPSKDELINLSQVRYLKNDAVTTSGLWLNFDEDNQLQNGSALSVVLNFYNALNVKEMEGKKVKTDFDKNGYLSVKAY